MPIFEYIYILRECFSLGCTKESPREKHWKRQKHWICGFIKSFRQGATCTRYSLPVVRVDRTRPHLGLRCALVMAHCVQNLMAPVSFCRTCEIGWG